MDILIEMLSFVAVVVIVIAGAGAYFTMRLIGENQDLRKRLDTVDAQLDDVSRTMKRYEVSAAKLDEDKRFAITTVAEARRVYNEAYRMITGGGNDGKKD